MVNLHWPGQQNAHVQREQMGPIARTVSHLDTKITDVVDLTIRVRIVAFVARFLLVMVLTLCRNHRRNDVTFRVFVKNTPADRTAHPSYFS